MVEAHPLPHCKGIAPTQAENQLAKPPFLVGQSCPGCSHVACATPLLVQLSGAATHCKLRRDSVVSCSDVPVTRGNVVVGHSRTG